MYKWPEEMTGIPSDLGSDVLRVRESNQPREGSQRADTGRSQRYPGWSQPPPLFFCQRRKEGQQEDQWDLYWEKPNGILIAPPAEPFLPFPDPTQHRTIAHRDHPTSLHCSVQQVLIIPSDLLQGTRSHTEVRMPAGLPAADAHNPSQLPAPSCTFLQPQEIISFPFPEI